MLQTLRIIANRWHENNQKKENKWFSDEKRIKRFSIECFGFVFGCVVVSVCLRNNWNPIQEFNFNYFQFFSTSEPKQTLNSKSAFEFKGKHNERLDCVFEKSKSYLRTIFLKYVYQWNVDDNDNIVKLEIAVHIK